MGSHSSAWSRETGSMIGRSSALEFSALGARLGNVPRFVMVLRSTVLVLVSLLACSQSDGSFDVCKCQSCSHPYGACPGETLPYWCPRESHGSQPCSCSHPGATVSEGACPGVTYTCVDGRWAADATCMAGDAGDAATPDNSD